MSPLVILALALIAIVALNLLYLSMALIVPLLVTALCVAMTCIVGAFFISKIAALGAIGQFDNALPMAVYVTAWLLIVALARVVIREIFADCTERTTQDPPVPAGQVSH